MKISINTPCHENWDAMTPNEKGAFCLSCQKNVVDFSKKTVSEIKDFFKAVPETESVCGRFEESQLDDMSFDHFHSGFKNWHYFQKAAVVIFFVFGFSLFGCAQNHPDRAPDIKMGTVAYVPEDTIKPVCKKDTTKTTHRPIKGKVKVTPEERPKKKNPPPHLMGDVMIDDTKH